MDWANACGGTCVEDIARLKGEETRDVGDDFVDAVEHVGGTAFLNGLSVDVEVEMDGLNIEEFLLGNPFADSG